MRERSSALACDGATKLDSRTRGYTTGTFSGFYDSQIIVTLKAWSKYVINVTLHRAGGNKVERREAQWNARTERSRENMQGDLIEHVGRYSSVCEEWRGFGADESKRE